jgi:hypothetical protein
MTFRGLEIWDLGIIARVGVRELGEIERLSFRAVKQWVERNGRSGCTSARAEHRRNGDPGLWVRNKEQWADRGSEPPDPSCLCKRTPCQDLKS